MRYTTHSYDNLNEKSTTQVMNTVKNVLFINAIRPATFDALELLQKSTGVEVRPIVFVDTKIASRVTERNGQKDHIDKIPFIEVDFDSPTSIMHAIRSLNVKIDGIVCQYENSIYEFEKIIPYFPELPLPTEKSLVWSTEKKLMRELMGAYDEQLVPAFLEVHNDELATIEAIESKIPYPLIIKPSGLEGALLVSLVHDRDELQRTLKKGFEHIQNAYDTWIKRQKPFFLAEEFMDGDMYSIDVYVDNVGNCVCTPIVEVITGKKVGYDDFFGYVRKTPADAYNEQAAAEHVAIASCKALGLRSITAHVELMRMTDGRWKIIELGPRIGGYRHDMYLHGYGINHIGNDILNRLNLPVVMQENPLGHIAMYNIYARSEGKITGLHGYEAVKQLPSTIRIHQALSVGDNALFAKHNGDVVFEVLLFNNDIAQFENDCSSVERLLTIDVSQSQ
jgi:hypothetical protein